MSQKHMCSSCQVGRIKSYYFSIDQAIVICDNLDCESYLDKWPWESIVTNPISESGSFAKYERALSYSSGINSDCDVATLSPAASQSSLADKEVEFLLSHSQSFSGSCSLDKQQKVKSPYIADKQYSFDETEKHSQHAPNRIDGGPFDPLNDITFENLISYSPKQNINFSLGADSAQDLDLWLQKIEHSPRPISSLSDAEKLTTPLKIDSPIISPLKNLIPSCGSAFSQVSPTKLPTPGKVSANSSNKVMRELSFDSGVLSTCKGNKDLLSLANSNFLSPASSGISEDSGFTDEDNANKLSKHLPNERPSCTKLRYLENKGINSSSSQNKLKFPQHECAKLKNRKPLSLSSFYNLFDINISNEVRIPFKSPVINNDHFHISDKSSIPPSPPLHTSNLPPPLTPKAEPSSSTASLDYICSSLEGKSLGALSSSSDLSKDSDRNSTCDGTPCDTPLNITPIYNILPGNSVQKDDLFPAEVGVENAANSTLKYEEIEVSIDLPESHCTSGEVLYTSCSEALVSSEEKTLPMPLLSKTVMHSKVNDSLTYVSSKMQDEPASFSTQNSLNSRCDILLQAEENYSETLSSMTNLPSVVSLHGADTAAPSKLALIEGSNLFTHDNAKFEKLSVAYEQTPPRLTESHQVANGDGVDIASATNSEQVSLKGSNQLSPSSSIVLGDSPSQDALSEEDGVTQTDGRGTSNSTAAMEDSFIQQLASTISDDILKVEPEISQELSKIVGSSPKEENSEDFAQSHDDITVSYVDKYGKTCLLDTLDKSTFGTTLDEREFSCGLKISEFVPPPLEKRTSKPSDSPEDYQKNGSYSHRSLTKFKDQFDKDRWSIAELYLDELDIEVVLKNNQNCDDPQSKSNHVYPETYSLQSSQKEASDLSKTNCTSKESPPRSSSAPSLIPSLKTECDINESLSVAEAPKTARPTSTSLEKLSPIAELKDKESEKLTHPNVATSTEDHPNPHVKLMKVFKPMQLVPEVAQEPFVTKSGSSFISFPKPEGIRHSVSFHLGDAPSSEEPKKILKGRHRYCNYLNDISSSIDLDEMFFNGTRLDGSKSISSDDESPGGNLLSLVDDNSSDDSYIDSNSCSSFEKESVKHLFTNKIKKDSKKASNTGTAKKRGDRVRSERKKPRIYQRKIPVITVCKNDEILIDDMGNEGLKLNLQADSSLMNKTKDNFKNGFLKSSNKSSNKQTKFSKHLDSRVPNGSLSCFSEVFSKSKSIVEQSKINSSALKDKWLQKNSFFDSATLLPPAASNDSVTFDHNELISLALNNEFGNLNSQSIFHPSQTISNSAFTQGLVHQFSTSEDLFSEESNSRPSSHLSTCSDNCSMFCEEQDTLKDSALPHSPPNIDFEGEDSMTECMAHSYTSSPPNKLCNPPLPQLDNLPKSCEDQKAWQPPSFESLQANLAKCSTEGEILKVLRESGWILTSCNPNIDYSPVNSKSPTVIPLPLKQRYSQIASDIIMWTPVADEAPITTLNASTPVTPDSSKAVSDNLQTTSLNSKRRLNLSPSPPTHHSKGNQNGNLRKADFASPHTKMQPRPRSKPGILNGKDSTFKRKLRTLQNSSKRRKIHSHGIDKSITTTNNEKLVRPSSSTTNIIIPGAKNVATLLKNATYHRAYTDHSDLSVSSQFPTNFKIKTKDIDSTIMSEDSSELDTTTSEMNSSFDVSTVNVKLEKPDSPEPPTESNPLTTISVEGRSSFLRPTLGMKRKIAEMRLRTEESNSSQSDEEEVVIELPDDFLAYEQICREGSYSVEPPKRPVTPPVIPLPSQKPPNDVPLKMRKKRKLKEKSHQRKKRKLKPADSSVEAVKEEETLEQLFQKKAEDALEEMVSKKDSNEVPSMICMCFGGKMYVYHRGET